MSRPLFLFRPEPGWSESAARARALGLEVRGEPLFAVEPAEWTPPDPAGHDALIAGSANVFRHGGAGLARYSHLPVHCVGQATAEAARSAGFSVASIGRGGLQSVVDGLPADARLLRLAGESHVPLDLPPAMRVDTVIVYRSRPVALARQTRADMARGGVAALHSGEAARHFAAEIDRAGIERESLSLLALGPRIAACAGAGWRAIHIAERPEEGALLAMALQMCHTPE